MSISRTGAGSDIIKQMKENSPPAPQNTDVRVWQAAWEELCSIIGASESYTPSKLFHQYTQNLNALNSKEIQEMKDLLITQMRHYQSQPSEYRNIPGIKKIEDRFTEVTGLLNQIINKKENLVMSNNLYPIINQIKTKMIDPYNKKTHPKDNKYYAILDLVKLINDTMNNVKEVATAGELLDKFNELKKQVEKVRDISDEKLQSSFFARNSKTLNTANQVLKEIEFKINMLTNNKNLYKKD